MLDACQGKRSLTCVSRTRVLEVPKRCLWSLSRCLRYDIRWDEPVIQLLPPTSSSRYHKAYGIGMVLRDQDRQIRYLGDPGSVFGGPRCRVLGPNRRQRPACCSRGRDFANTRTGTIGRDIGWSRGSLCRDRKVQLPIQAKVV
jgi:hypothetical protein